MDFPSTFIPWLLSLASCFPPAAISGELHGLDVNRHDFRLDETVNERPAFQINLWTDREDRVYEVGEPLSFCVKSQRDCYINLFRIDTEGRVEMPVPGDIQSDNFLSAGDVLRIPAEDAWARPIARPPFGEKLNIVIATTEKLNLRNIYDGVRYDFSLTRSGKNPPTVTKRWLKDFVAQLDEDFGPAGWTEDRIRTQTVPVGSRKENARQVRRWLVAVGIAEYEDDTIRNLRAAANDAREVASVLCRYGGFEKLGVLVNGQATKAAVRKLLFNELPRVVGPGDTVLIYWSGHGGRTLDLDNDERDGFDEYLMLYDSKRTRPETMLLDDTLARWTAPLDQCKLVLLLDNCYAAGSPKTLDAAEAAVFDCLDNELRGAKSVGRTNSVMLAACKAYQMAYEHKQRRLSVMTYYLLDEITKQNEISVTDAYTAIAELVPKYVREEYDAQQDPVLDGDLADQILLRRL